MAAHVVDAPAKDEAILKKGQSPLFRKGQGDLEFAYRYVLENFKKASRGTFSFEEVLRFDAIERPEPPSLELKVVMERYTSFKKFDTVSDHSDDYFSEYSWTQRPKDWEEKVFKEWKDIEEQLPENMLVRAYEGRMELLRVVIIGPKGTPYHDGLFFFDVCFPSTYPATPPRVHYYSHGLSIHENVHTSGSVSLYQTIRDDGPERNEKIWVPGTSTMLHFLDFLKNRFCAEPLLNGYVYNDPNWFDGVPSLFYNELTFIKSVKTMVTIMNKPPNNFEDFVVGHFRYVAVDVVKACRAYMEGVQVGCLVDGVPKEGNKGIISVTFKNNLASSFKPLVAAFERIGAKVDTDLNPPR